MSSKHSLLYKNGLSVAFLLLTVLSLAAQAYTGLVKYNNFRVENHISQVTFCEYLGSGHFIQATFENWESEFLQMGLFVWFTVFLRQIGSSESKKLNGKEEVDKEPKNHKSAPWPVSKGGWVLAVYKHSLTIALFLLFGLSFLLHWYGSFKDFNEQQILEGKPVVSFFSFLGTSKMWFESLQNWQSEFLSVFAIVVLSIYLREIGSPQSKPVDAPNFQTGE